MAEETTEKEANKKDPKKDNNKILVVFGGLIVAAVILYFVSNKNMQKTAVTPGGGTTNTTVTGAPTGSASSSDLTSKKWTWVKTQMSDGAVTTPSKEGAFTTTFQTDGRVVATTDCNNGNGAYTLGADNALTIGPLASTMMYCEGSSENAYFQQLGNVGSYKISDGQLWLMIKKDSGTMIFQ